MINAIRHFVRAEYNLNHLVEEWNHNIVRILAEQENEKEK